MTDNPIKISPDASGSSCGEREPYALQVLGEDMAPEFPDKCIIVIEPDDRKISDSYIVAEVEGIKWFRQYRKEPDGREFLYACNPIYPEIELNGLEWSVVGLIRQRNIRRDIKHFSYENE